MKVLIACNVDSNPNPFVPTLADGIRSTGCSVVCSIDDFWNKWNEYDIIHLQWPDLLVNKTDEELRSNLQNIKKAGIPIIITCHNLYAHGKDSRYEDVYKTIFEAVDCFVHMGTESKNICEMRYPSTRHVIIPHHIYNTLYKEIPTREDALKHFGLSSKYRYILCMGAFRNDAERELVAQVASHLKNAGVVILAPNYRHLYAWNKARHMPAVKGIMFFLKDKLNLPNVIFHRDMVPEEEMPFYYAASDVALIHRNDILNSGNLPMAFMFGKSVVGPFTGNVGGILKETGNLTFEPYNNSSVVDALTIMLSSNYKEIGERNKRMAMESWNVDTVASQYNSLYNQMISK